MGLFGFIGEVASAGIKLAVTPIAVVDDVFSIVTGSEPDTTKKFIKSAGNDLEKAVDEIIP